MLSVFSKGRSQRLSFFMAFFSLFFGGVIHPIWAGTQSPKRISVQPAPTRVQRADKQSASPSWTEPFYERAPSMLNSRDLAVYIADKPNVHYAANHERTLRQIGVGLAVTFALYLIRAFFSLLL